MRYAWIMFFLFDIITSSLYNSKHIRTKGSLPMKIVVKVGTSTLTHAAGHLNIRRTEKLCRVLADLKNAGHEVILVSSGAIGMGVGKLGLRKRPDDMPGKQAAAAIGQCELMYIYDKMFSEYSHTVAQILLTAEDVKNEERHQNFTNTITRLLEYNVLPIINENDTISVSEIKIGDNDQLSAIVASSVHADLLVILTDMDGLYTSDPRKDPSARLIPEVNRVDEAILKLGGSSGTSRGTGGMATKLEAAKMATEAGIDTIIVQGRDPEILYAVLDGTSFRGTRFRAQNKGV